MVKNKDYALSLAELTNQFESIAKNMEGNREIGPVLTTEEAIADLSDKNFIDPIIKSILSVEVISPYLSDISIKKRT